MKIYGDERDEITEETDKVKRESEAVQMILFIITLLFLGYVFADHIIRAME